MGQKEAPRVSITCAPAQSSVYAFYALAASCNSTPEVLGAGQAQWTLSGRDNCDCQVTLSECYAIAAGERGSSSLRVTCSTGHGGMAWLLLLCGGDDASQSRRAIPVPLQLLEGLSIYQQHHYGQ